MQFDILLVHLCLQHFALNFEPRVKAAFIICHHFRCVYVRSGFTLVNIIALRIFRLHCARCVPLNWLRSSILNKFSLFSIEYVKKRITYIIIEGIVSE